VKRGFYTLSFNSPPSSPDSVRQLAGASYGIYEGRRREGSPEQLQ